MKTFPGFTTKFKPDALFERDIKKETKHLQEFARRGFYPNYMNPHADYDDRTRPEEFSRVLKIVVKHLERVRSKK